MSRARRIASLLTASFVVFVPLPARAEGEEVDPVLDAVAEVVEGAVLGDGFLLVPVEPGDGAGARTNDLVTLEYKAALLEDDAVFEDSASLGRPAALVPKDAVRCLRDGLAKLGVGARARLICAPAAAYGQAGDPPLVPPDAYVYFDVHVVSIERRP
jgi:FKBP-type peptidyl-prolyl cis-trans isomerase FkpA